MSIALARDLSSFSDPGGAKVKARFLLLFLLMLVPVIGSPDSLYHTVNLDSAPLLNKPLQFSTSTFVDGILVYQLEPTIQILNPDGSTFNQFPVGFEDGRYFYSFIPTSAGKYTIISQITLNDQSIATSKTFTIEGENIEFDAFFDDIVLRPGSEAVLSGSMIMQHGTTPITENITLSIGETDVCSVECSGYCTFSCPLVIPLQVGEHTAHAELNYKGTTYHTSNPFTLDIEQVVSLTAKHEQEYGLGNIARITFASNHEGDAQFSAVFTSPSGGTIVIPSKGDKGIFTVTLDLLEEGVYTYNAYLASELAYAEASGNFSVMAPEKQVILPSLLHPETFIFNPGSGLTIQATVSLSDVVVNSAEVQISSSSDELFLVSPMEIHGNSLVWEASNQSLPFGELQGEIIARTDSGELRSSFTILSSEAPIISMVPNAKLIDNLTYNLSEYFEWSGTKTYIVEGGESLNLSLESDILLISRTESSTTEEITVSIVTDIGTYSAAPFIITVGSRQQPVQQVAVVGKPVLWSAEVVEENTTIEIPITAEEITLDSQAPEGLTLTANNITVNTSDVEETLLLKEIREETEEYMENYDSLNVIGKARNYLDMKSRERRLENTLEDASDLAIELENTTNLTLSLENTTGTLEFKTPAPELIESEETETSGKIVKNFTISSEHHYTNVHSFLDIPEAHPEQVTLLWQVDGEYLDVQSYAKARLTNFTMNDTNGDGRIDRLEWITPHLSDQNFSLEISLTILNVQSYPIVQGDWEVRFNTTGTSDLYITPTLGTTFGEFFTDVDSTEDDLLFGEVYCGDQLMNDGFTAILEDNSTLALPFIEQTDMHRVSSIYYEDWNCDQKNASLRNTVDTPGEHYISFTFGNHTMMAQNLASGAYTVRVYIWETQGNANPADDELIDNINQTFGELNGSLEFVGTLSESLYNYSDYLVEIQVQVGSNYSLDADSRLETAIMAENRFGLFDHVNTSEYVISTTAVPDDGHIGADIFVANQSHVDYSVDADAFEVGYIPGDPDVVYGLDNTVNEVRVLENPGIYEVATNWTEYITANNANDASAISAADLDGDGDNDILSGEFSQDVHIFENDYTNAWTVSHVDTAAGDSVVSITYGDFDLDGDPDIVVGTDDESAQALVIYENDGTPFNGVWNEQGMDVGYHPTGIATVDLDNDGDLDILSCQLNPDVLVAFQNDFDVDGDPFNGAWQPYMIYNVTNQCRDVSVADLDRDGYMDVVVTSVNNADEVVILQNDFAVDGNVWDDNWTVSLDITTGNQDGLRTAFADFDLDNDLDIAVLLDGGDDLYWYESDGTPFNGGWTDHVIDNAVASLSLNGGRGTLRGSLEVADIDGDGRPDIVVNNFGNNGATDIMWYQNIDATNDNWNEYDLVTDGIEQAYQLFAADFDNDNNSNTLDFYYNDTQSIELGIEGDAFNGWDNLTAHENYSFSFIMSPDNNISGSYMDTITMMIGNESVSQFEKPYEKLFGAARVPIRFKFDWEVNREIFYNISDMNVTPDSLTANDNATIYCQVTNNETAANFVGYDVYFFNSTGHYLGTNQTQADGFAAFSTQFNYSGLHEVKCEISTATEVWNMTDRNFSLYNVTVAGAPPPAWSDPSAYLPSPVLFNTNRTYQFNTTWTAANGLATVLIEHNFTGVRTNYTPESLGAEFFYNYTGIPAGIFIWKYHANDTLGQTNQTSEFTYQVFPDTQAPTITLDFPLNGSILNTSNFNYSFLPIDNAEDYFFCNITTNYTDVTYNMSVVNNTLRSYFAVEHLPGEYQWYAECADGTGNTVISPRLNFTVAFGEGHYRARVYVRDTQGDADPTNDAIVLEKNYTGVHLSNHTILDLGNLNYTESIYNYSTYSVEITLETGWNYTLDADEMFETYIKSSNRFGLVDAMNTTEYVVTSSVVGDEGDRIADIFYSNQSGVDYSVANNVAELGHIRGDLDVVAGYDNLANEVVWYQNPNQAVGLYETTGNWSATTLDIAANDALALTTSDLDRDGDTDIIQGEQNDDIHVSENFYPSPFVSLIADTSGTDDILALATGDLDNDGDQDIIAGMDQDGAHSLVVYDNDGTPFDAAWAERNIQGVNRVVSVATADLDLDGDLDIVACDHTGDNVTIYRNDFDVDGDPFNAAWPGTIIFTGTTCTRVAVGDFGRDGHMDIIVSYQSDADVVTLLRNDYVGDGDVWDDAWENVTTVYTAAENGYDVSAADMDNDGDLDIVALMDAGNDLYWFESDGTPFDGGWTASSITNNFGSISIASNGRARGGIAIVDMDNDGDPDIVGGHITSTNPEVEWYENALPATSWTVHSIVDRGLEQIFAISVGDFDNDNSSNVLDFYWNATEGLEEGITGDLFSGMDNLSSEANHSFYFLLSPDNNFTGDVRENITLYVGDETHHTWAKPNEKIYGAYVTPIAVRFEWNVNRRKYYNISNSFVDPIDANLSINPAFPTFNYTAHCQVTDNASQVPIFNHTVNFYNSTNDLIYTGQTNTTGWANFTFNVSSLGEHNVTCNISQSPEVWIFTDVNSSTLFFNASDTIIPTYVNYTIGFVNGSNMTRFNSTYIWANWSDNYYLNDSRVEHNASGSFMNYSSQPLSGYEDIGNHSLNFSNASEFVNFGPMEIRLHGVDLQGNGNRTEPSYYVTLWRYANLTNLQSGISGPIVENDTVILNCSVFDPYNSTGVPEYHVSISDNVTGLIGTNVTNESGNMSYVFSYPSRGEVNLTCSISNNESLYYLAYDVTELSTQFFVYGLSYLNISDQTDPPTNTLATVFDQIDFFANYSNSSLLPINRTQSTCNITFNLTTGWTPAVNMTYNSTLRQFQYNRTFNETGLLAWNVSCADPEYVAVNANDTITISPLQVIIEAPSNGTNVDRDEYLSTMNTSLNLTSRITQNQEGVNISFYANLTNPAIADNVYLFIGENTTNATGHATFDWNPNSSYFAGNYTLWANASYGGNQVSQIGSTLYSHIYGALNTSFSHPLERPNASYRKPVNVTFYATITSPGPENISILNSSYDARLNLTLRKPSLNTTFYDLLYNGTQWNSSYELFLPDEHGTWNASVNGSANFSYFIFNTSRSFEVFNELPNQSTPILNSSNGTNFTFENLTVYPQLVQDIENDSVKNITTWSVNGGQLFDLYYPFEGGSNNSGTHDYSGYERNATVHGATWNQTEGYDGFGAYTFDGLGDHINSTDVDYSVGNFSVVAWVRQAEIDTHPIISKASSYTSQNFFVYAHNVSSGGIVAGLHDGTTFRNVSGPVLSADRWYHVAFTVNSTHLELFLDGASQGRTTHDGSLQTNDDNISIGRAYDSTAFFNGTLDEVAIYNRSLSPAQVEALFNNRTDIIVSQETSRDEIWQSCLTPSDRDDYGATLCSNSLQIRGYLAITAPGNDTIVDRDGVSADHADTINISVSTYGDVGVNVSFFANLTLPSGLNRTNLSIGSALSNDAGLATLSFNPNGSWFAGNYTIWANASNATLRNTSTVLIYGGLNVTYTFPHSPNTSYIKGDPIEVYVNITSLGIENRSAINSTYAAYANTTLQPPTNVSINLTLWFNGSIWENLSGNLSNDAESGFWEAATNASATFFFNASVLRLFEVNSSASNLTAFDTYHLNSSLRANTCTPFTIYANYSVAFDGSPIVPALCNVTFVNGSRYDMVYNPSSLLWEYNISHVYSGTQTYNVSCFADRYDDNSTVNSTAVLNNVSLSLEKNITSLGDNYYNLSFSIDNLRDCPVFNATIYDLLPLSFIPSNYSEIANGTQIVSGEYDGNASYWQFQLGNFSGKNFSYIALGNASAKFSVLDMHIVGMDPPGGAFS